MTEDISFDKNSAKVGEVVTVRVTASSDTKLDALSSTPKINFVTVKEGEEYTFVMPNENVVVKARFTSGTEKSKKVDVVNHRANKPKATVQKRRKFPINATAIFIFLMLFYPILQFLIMWFGVNINSILLTFKDQYMNFLPFDNFFKNYTGVILDMQGSSVLKMYTNSLVYLVLNCFITLPVSLFFAYFIFKKIYMGGGFKAVFYLPSVLPTVILTLVFQSMFNTGGLLYPVFNAIGLNSSTFFMNGTEKWMVWIFCFWTGIGYDVMLLTAGMARIPRDLLESAKMDGVSPLKEFFHIIIPLTWPTITTLFIFGMMGVFGTYLQPMLLTGTIESTKTIGLVIFNESQSAAKNHPATIGMVCTLVATPIVLGVRSLLNHFFKEVNF